MARESQDGLLVYLGISAAVHSHRGCLPFRGGKRPNRNLGRYGLISRDHAIVRLIKSSKVEIIGKKTRLVEQSPELRDLKGDRPRVGRHDP